MSKVKFLWIFALVAAFMNISCKKDVQNAKYYSVEVNIVAPENGFVAPKSYKVLFNNVGNGENITANFTDLKGTVDKIITGTYNITISAQYSGNGFSMNYLGSVENFSVSKENLSVNIPLKVSKTSDLVFKEIHYNAAENLKGKKYLKDTYFEIYNNSDKTVYADGLCLGDARSYKKFKFSSPELKGKEDDYIFIGSYVWKIPGDGTKYPIAPGESFIIAAWAKDHSKESKSLDLSTAEFETVCQKYLDKGQTNCNAVDMILECTISPNSLANQLGQFRGAAWVLFYPEVALRKDGKYLESNKPKNYGQEVLKSSVLDAVDCVSKETDDKRLPSDIDAGKIWCKSTGGNQSIVRKVASTSKDGRKIYKDTNNTSEDFEISNKPEIRRNGAKRPSWSTWNTAQ